MQRLLIVHCATTTDVLLIEHFIADLVHFYGDKYTNDLTAIMLDLLGAANGAKAWCGECDNYAVIPIGVNADSG